MNENHDNVRTVSVLKLLWLTLIKREAVPVHVITQWVLTHGARTWHPLLSVAADQRCVNHNSLWVWKQRGSRLQVWRFYWNRIKCPDRSNKWMCTVPEGVLNYRGRTGGKAFLLLAYECHPLWTLLYSHSGTNTGFFLHWRWYLRRLSSPNFTWSPEGLHYNLLSIIYQRRICGIDNIVAWWHVCICTVTWASQMRL